MRTSYIIYFEKPVVDQACVTLRETFHCAGCDYDGILGNPFTLRGFSILKNVDGTR